MSVARWSALVVVLGLAALPARAQHRPHHGRHHRAVHVDPRYVRMRTRWHRAATRDEVRAWEARLPRPPLVLRPIAQGDPVTLTPDRDDGGFGPDDLALARIALRDRRSNGEHDVPPILLDRVYRAVRHFHAPWAWVVSGYRASAGTSRHASGNAVDVVLPGVSDATLAALFRANGFSGVGTYPLSGFVHCDVRNRSYFWVDASAPGGANRTRGVRASEASRADVAARRRGEPPPLAAESPTPEGEGEAEGDHDDSVPDETIPDTTTTTITTVTTSHTSTSPAPAPPPTHSVPRPPSGARQ